MYFYALSTLLCKEMHFFLLNPMEIMAKSEEKAYSLSQLLCSIYTVLYADVSVQWILLQPFLHVMTLAG